LLIKAHQAKPIRESKLSCVNIDRPPSERTKKNTKCNSIFVGNERVNRINNTNKNIQLGEFWTNIENRIKVLKSRISPAHSNKSTNSVKSAQSRSDSVN
jgi:hypothetical protein